MLTPVPTSGPVDHALRGRADAVLPGGMYGHLATRVNRLPPVFPQFFRGGKGAVLTDVDGREYVDFMCAWGPMILGYGDTVAERAFARQAAIGDVLNGPGEPMVELAELLVETVAHADWALFAKNGNDATSTACRIARAATGRSKILKAAAAYHGASADFTPVPVGVTAEDRANLILFDYNDLASLEEAAAVGDIAAVIVTPFRHDGFVDQDEADDVFVRGARALCDKIGAVLILDEVRTTLRIDPAGAWERYSIRPDLTCLSKALANGAPLAAVVGIDALKDAAADIYVTGSFWYGAAAHAAGLATVRELVDNDGIGTMTRAGAQYKAGLEAQADAAGVGIVHSGPVTMPFVRFIDDDATFTLAMAFSESALEHGAYIHPWHNGFISTAHTADVIDRALLATSHAFARVAALVNAR